MKHKFEFLQLCRLVRCPKCRALSSAFFRCGNCPVDMCVLCAWEQGCYVVFASHEHDLELVRSPRRLCSDCHKTVDTHYALFCARCCRDIICLPCDAGHLPQFLGGCNLEALCGDRLALNDCSLK